MKKKIKKEYLRRTRKLLETKLYSQNLIKEINIQAVSLIRYSGPFLKWMREDRKQIDEGTRKLMTMHKALYPRDGVDRLYVLRKERGRGRGLNSIEDSIDATIQLREDIKKHGGRLITATRRNTDNANINIIKINRKQNWEEKQLWILQTTNK